MCDTRPLLLLAIFLTTACVTTVEEPPDPVEPGVGASLVLERFLRAANENDLDTMARLFGTKDGSILQRDGRTQAEQRMFILASLLRHDDYVIQDNEIVPGRMREATRLMVRMQFRDRTVVVPFTMVRSGDGWLVERIGVERITNPPDLDPERPVQR